MLVLLTITMYIYNNNYYSNDQVNNFLHSNNSFGLAPLIT